MTGLIWDFIVAIGVKAPFPVAWKRVRHERYGHPFTQSTLLETHRYWKHPQNHDDYVYTVHLRHCDDCGMCFHDQGFEDLLTFEQRMERVARRADAALPALMEAQRWSA